MDLPAPGPEAAGVVRIVGVRFQKTGRVYYFDPKGAEFDRGDWVIVETQRGLEAGEVVVTPRLIPASQVPRPLRPVVRRVEAGDVSSRDRWKAKEDEAYRVGSEKIAHHGLPMKLIDTEYSFDGSRLTFYFAAEGRVDFRELVRDLAGTFRTRIDLRQIGARDVARMVGGIGPCGHETCCSTFLHDFRPITIRMAKEQKLALNPEKLSGLCGRLMCCLAFEIERHEAAPVIDGGDEAAGEEPEESYAGARNGGARRNGGAPAA